MLFKMRAARSIERRKRRNFLPALLDIAFVWKIRLTSVVLMAVDHHRRLFFL
jgi:hypothetical protein